MQNRVGWYKEGMGVSQLGPPLSSPCTWWLNVARHTLQWRESTRKPSLKTEFLLLCPTSRYLLLFHMIASTWLLFTMIRCHSCHSSLTLDCWMHWMKGIPFDFYIDDCLSGLDYRIALWSVQWLGITSGWQETNQLLTAAIQFKQEQENWWLFEMHIIVKTFSEQ